MAEAMKHLNYDIRYHDLVSGAMWRFPVASPPPKSRPAPGPGPGPRPYGPYAVSAPDSVSTTALRPLTDGYGPGRTVLRPLLQRYTNPRIPSVFPSRTDERFAGVHMAGLGDGTVSPGGPQ